jgi:hypothetical protein
MADAAISIANRKSKIANRKYLLSPTPYPLSPAFTSKLDILHSTLDIQSFIACRVGALAKTGPFRSAVRNQFTIPAYRLHITLRKRIAAYDRNGQKRRNCERSEAISIHALVSTVPLFNSLISRFPGFREFVFYRLRS